MAHETTAASVRRPDPFVLVIFGASGDLTERKLVPAVYNLFREKLLPERFAVLGYARSEADDEAFRDAMRHAVETHSRTGVCDETCWTDFASRLHYHRGQYDDPADIAGLGKRLAEIDPGGDRQPNVLYYLATPPETFVPIVETLGEAGLAKRDDGGGMWTRIVVEKPFGRDLESALDLDRRLRRPFAENQVYRIDHYLGKETVQNLFVLRFANAIFEPLWNQKYVDHVQITVAETVGMEGRGGYYDRAGALRDIVQNHMMHLVSLVAMEPPLTLAADSIRDEKVKIVQALRRIDPDRAASDLVRGRYTAGHVKGDDVPGYTDEKGVEPDSRTETFAALRVFIDNWRWAGVPFYLRTGKRMPVRMTEIGIHFRPIPQVLFNADPDRPVEPNVLAIRIQPNEGISMRFQVKVPGPAMRVEPFQMDFGYARAFSREPPEAYERLILDAALGDATLFTRRDEVEAAWRFLAPILDAAAAADAPPPTYEAGTWGPKEADDLLARDGRQWMLVRRPGAEGD